MNPIITKRCSPIEEAIYQDGFQAGAASRDVYIEQLELALLQVRKAICGDIHNTDDLLDLIASRDAEVAKAFEAGRQAEREDCAKVCDKLAYEWRGANSRIVECAAAIRARGDTK